MRRCVAALVLLLPAPAFAKDLGGHLGVGFAADLGLGPTGTMNYPAFSLRYGVPTGGGKLNIGLQADVGLAWTTSASPGLYAGGRVLWGLVAEDNMNFDLVLGGGYHAEDGNNYAVLRPALGAEFFLFGLENLGLEADLGLEVDIGTATSLATSPGVQLHYYF